MINPAGLPPARAARPATSAPHPPPSRPGPHRPAGAARGPARPKCVRGPRDRHGGAGVPFACVRPTVRRPRPPGGGRGTSRPARRPGRGVPRPPAGAPAAGLDFGPAPPIACSVTMRPMRISQQHPSVPRRHRRGVGPPPRHPPRRIGPASFTQARAVQSSPEKHLSNRRTPRRITSTNEAGGQPRPDLPSAGRRAGVGQRGRTPASRG
jgi:hypothetical protein